MPTYEWDEDNEEHLVRHGITRTEAEQALGGPIVELRGRTDRPDRRYFLGRTAGGRYLALVVQLKGGDLMRPFAGWDMIPYERELYGRQASEK